MKIYTFKWDGCYFGGRAIILSTSLRKARAEVEGALRNDPSLEERHRVRALDSLVLETEVTLDSRPGFLHYETGDY